MYVRFDLGLLLLNRQFWNVPRVIHGFRLFQKYFLTDHFGKCKILIFVKLVCYEPKSKNMIFVLVESPI